MPKAPIFHCLFLSLSNTRIGWGAGELKHWCSSPPLDNLLHARVWPHRPAPYSPNVRATALQDIPCKRDLLSRTSKEQTRLRVPRGTYQHLQGRELREFFNPPPISLPPEPPPFLSVLASNKFDLARLLWWHRFSLSPSPIPRWGPNGRPRAWGCWWWSCTSCPRWRRRSGRSWSRCWSPWGCSGGAPPTNSSSSERTQADEPGVDR